ncbi:MAG: hypothetical protein HZC17_08415 [Candidatus Omnitrophica bacterium]|nr:hypothetical protein [Candidatus Omnitrophota bacterium]
MNRGPWTVDRGLLLILVLTVGLAIPACGKKKDKTDIIADLESKPVVTEVKSEAKPAAEEKKEAEPKVVDNSPNPVSTDIQPTQTPVPSTSATPATTPTQGYEVSAQKVGAPSVPSAPGVPQVPAVPQTPAPYPPYQGYKAPQQGAASPYSNPYGAPPPNPYYGGYTPPQKYKAPGPIESTGEFIGHLVNPFKRKEDESKKTYKGI